jgi:hypothetical protein
MKFLKPVLFYFLGFLLFSLNNTLNAQIEFNGPAILASETSIDFKQLDLGTKAEQKIELKNIGKNALSIKSVKADCDCILAQWPKTPIAPGKSSVLVLRFDAKKPGKIKQTVVVTSDAINEPILSIKIKGNIGSKL